MKNVDLDNLIDGMVRVLMVVFLGAMMCVTIFFLVHTIASDKNLLDMKKTQVCE